MSAANNWVTRDCCRDHTAAEVSDEGHNIRPRSAKKRHRASVEQNSSQSDSDAEAVEAQEVSEAMADAYAQRAVPEQEELSQEAEPARRDTDAVVGVSGMEAIEAEAGQMFRCSMAFLHCHNLCKPDPLLSLVLQLHSLFGYMCCSEQLFCLFGTSLTIQLEKNTESLHH